MAFSMFAVPARPGWQTKTLADGSQIIVRLLGDEFFHYWETEDGKIAVEQEDGTFVVTNELQPTQEQFANKRKASKRYVNRVQKVGAATMPSRALFILVSFSNQTFKDASATYYKSKLGDSTEGAMSMYNYLKQQSNGQYAPPVDVFGPVALSQTYAYYGENDSQGDDKNPAQMIVDACKALDSQIDFSQYDANKDGVVDNVYVLYAGKGEADGGVKNTIWPHQWDISSAGLSLKLDGKSIRSYACSAELNGSGNCAMGTPLHEFSHVIGLPDYYDTEYESTNYTEQRTPGEWSLMDGGSYNNDGNTPPNYSIYDKYFLGWLTPKFLAQNEKTNVTLTTNYGDGYQITGGTSLVAATNANTVYYIENRQKTGWDEYLPGSGMVVWQVKYSSTNWNNNDLNNTGGSPRYTVLSASGDPKNIGKASDPFPGSQNVRTLDLFTGCAFTEIQKSGNDITFKFNGGSVKPECSYTLDGSHCSVPSDGVITTNTTLSLTITPDAGYTLADASCWMVSMGLTDLVYGTDFTYNANTNEFRIETVTDDVTILAQGKETFPITWKANGNTFTTTTSAGKVVLPTATPAIDCDDKVFVGWCATENYSNETTAPTFIKDGDAANKGAIFYAVFAKKGEGGGEENTKYTFTTAKWADATSSWSSDKDGASYMDDKNGVQVTTGASGAGATTKSSVTNVSKVVVKYCTNATKGAGSIKVVVGAKESTQDITKTGGTTLRDLEFAFDKASGKVSFEVSCSTNSIYINSVTIITSGGVSYSEYVTTCTPPCEGTLTGITLNTESVKKTFTEGETFNYDGLVVTANIDGCEDKTVKPTSVSAPDMSQIGKQEITVTYEGKSAKYEITIEALPTYAIRFFNNGEQVGATQNVKKGQAATKPASDPTACDDYTFGGWYTAALSETNTEKPSYVTDFTATKDQDYYAVFSMSEEGEGSAAFDGQTAGTYKIYADVNGTKYYAKGTANSSNKVESTTNESEAASFKFSKSSSNFTIQANDKYLYYSGSSTDIGFQNDSYVWSVESQGNDSWRILTGTRAFALRVTTDYKTFGAYSTTNASASGYYFNLNIEGGAVSTTYYTTAPSCEACTAKVNVTKGTASHGSFSLDKTSEQSTCGGPLVVTVTATPDEGYRFKEITQTGIEGAVIDQDAKTVTYAKKADGASTINVAFEAIPKYTVRFYSNGNMIKTQDLYAGNKAEKPADPSADCTDYTFVGWYTEELPEANTEKPSYVTDFTATKDQDYYAIYSKTEKSESGSGSKNITLDPTTIKSFPYQGITLSVSDGTLTNGTDYRVYKGHTLTITSSVGKMTSIAFTYKGASYDGGGWNDTYTPNAESWTSPATNGEQARITQIIVTVPGGPSSITYYTSTVTCHGSGTSVENVSQNEPVAIKAIMNGQIVIIRGEAVYTLTGARVQ